MAKTSKNDTPEKPEETQAPAPEEATSSEAETTTKASTETGGGLVDSDGKPVIPADGRGLPWPYEASDNSAFLKSLEKHRAGKLLNASAALEAYPATVISGGIDRITIASRLLCSIIQLPAYSDIYKGVGDSGLQDGAVALSLIMTDKLIAADTRS